MDTAPLPLKPVPGVTLAPIAELLQVFVLSVVQPGLAGAMPALGEHH